MTTAHGPQQADGWTAAVRQRLGLGRLLPLGGPADGVWIAERAAASVLRSAAAGPGTVLGRLRIGVAMEANGTVLDVDGADRDAGVPAPPSALPSGPLRIEAEFAATADRPLPDAAEALRTALMTAASARLGLLVTEVDLRVTGLLEDDAPDRVTAPAEDEVRAAKAGGAAGDAAAGVPGVVALTQVLGSAVHTGADHLRVEVATAGDHRALDVARAVRTAVTAAVEGHPPVAVLVTAVVERD
ncbi:MULTISPECIES: hypothetical protein [unclassified Streptomyces]|uniref:hypothetical protein n=1 Tax=unclassified Streptomyces TaxID=2593676 RepID=UPI00093FD62E|nr:hypothetical protein [Streptomyces sp. TSRI0281]OKI45551.1 hypothetical protein A6A29_31200 [Streptomyces sp. TSRI0281]